MKNAISTIHLLLIVLGNTLFLSLFMFVILLVIFILNYSLFTIH